MVIKNKVREVLVEAIDNIVSYQGDKLPGLLGVKSVVEEFNYELSLLIGEQVALEEIKLQENTKDK